MAKLKEFPIQITGPGLIKHLPAYLLPKEGFQDVTNAKFLNGILSKVTGWTKFDAQQLTGTVMGIDQFFLSSGSDYLMVLTTTNMYKWNTTTSAFDDLNGTAFTGNADDNPFSTEVGFDLFVCANDKDTIKKWDGAAATFSALAGLTDVERLDGVAPIAVGTAACVRFFKNFFVLLNVTENGTRKPFRVRWSRLGLPENWKNTAAGDGQAGAADIGTVDWIVTAERLGNSLAIYKERSIWLMSYVGLPLIFDFRERISGLGIIGPRAIANLGDEHMFVGNDDIYFFNGDSVEPVGEPIRKFFFNDTNPSYLDKTTIFVIEEDNEAVIAYCSTASSGSYDKALVYNYLEKTWSLREIAATAFGYYRRSTDLTWANDSGTWDAPDYPGTWDGRDFLGNAPINLLGDSSGYIHQMTGGSKDGSAIALSATSKLHDFGKPDAFKRVWRLQLLLKKGGNYNLAVRIGTSHNVDDDVTWYGPYNFNLSDTTDPYIDVDISARLFTFEFTLGGVNQDVGMAGYIVHYSVKGQK